MAEAGVDELAMLWVLNLSDGRHSLLDIAERSGYAFAGISRAAHLLKRHGLLVDAADATASAPPADGSRPRPS